MNRENDMNITVNGGQLNISRDMSTLYVNQYNSDNNIHSELESIINEIMGDMYTLEKETASQLEDVVDMAKTELTKQTPQQSRLRNCLALLAPIITLANGTPKLLENLHKLQDLISSFIK